MHGTVYKISTEPLKFSDVRRKMFHKGKHASRGVAFNSIPFRQTTGLNNRNSADDVFKIFFTNKSPIVNYLTEKLAWLGLQLCVYMEVLRCPERGRSMFRLISLLVNITDLFHFD